MNFQPLQKLPHSSKWADTKFNSWMSKMRDSGSPVSRIFQVALVSIKKILEKLFQTQESFAVKKKTNCWYKKTEYLCERNTNLFNNE